MGDSIWDSKDDAEMPRICSHWKHCGTVDEGHDELWDIDVFVSLVITLVRRKTKMLSNVHDHSYSRAHKQRVPFLAL